MRLKVPLLWAALLCGWAVSDTIFLKNNRTIKGIVLNADADTNVVIIMIPQVGRMTIDRREIAEIRLDSDDGSKYIEDYSTPAPLGASPSPGARTPDAADPSGQGGGDAPTGGLEVAPPPALSESQQEDIQLWVRWLSDTRRRGGAGNRQAIARRELGSIGPAVIPYIQEFLDSPHEWELRNTWEIFADLAKSKDNAKYLLELSPVFIRGLQNENQYVRPLANGILESVADKRFGYPGALAGGPSAAERETHGKWQGWWNSEALPAIEEFKAAQKAAQDAD